MRKPLPFGKYLLLDRIAVGGMAEVFAAKTFGVEGFERLVAIKRILPTMVEDDEFITMFIDEARIAAQLSHANLVQIYELGKNDDTYYIAMEYVPGRDVRLIIDRFKKKGQVVPLNMAVFIMAKMCEGLDYAHRRKDASGNDLSIIHRDISPQNVLVSYEGEVKIIDFGIAKAAGRLQKTQAGILKGKFGYMSPEQVKGIPVDHRSDLYSCGVMLYEMLTGTKLFSGESDFSTLEKVRAGDIPSPSAANPDIPPALERIVLKALAKDRDERYQWCSELHDDLIRYLYTGTDVFSTKSLAQFMRDAFAGELVKEAERQKRWHTTAPEETADFDLAESRPPTQAPAAALAAARESAAREIAARESNPGPNGAAARVRIGPPSAFMTGELKLKERTSLHTPFEEPGNGRARPLQGSSNDRSQLVTEAASLAELGLVAAAAEEMDVDPRQARQRRGPSAVPFDVDSRRRSTGNSRRVVLDETLPPSVVEVEDDEEQATKVKAPREQNVEQRRARAAPDETDGVAAPVRPRGFSTAAVVAISILCTLILAMGAFKAWQVLGAQRGSLALTVAPRNAEVLVDGQPQKYDSLIVVRLPFGSHHLEVSADGYEGIEEDLTIDSKKLVRRDVVLQKEAVEAPPVPEEPAPVPAPAPAPAVVEDKAADPRAKDVKTGDGRAVKVADTPRGPDPRPAASDVRRDPPTPREPVKRVVAPPPRGTIAAATISAVSSADAAPGGLNVFSAPPRAMLAVNGKMVGRTPQRLTDLPGGKSVELKLVAPGYKPLTLNQEVPVGGTETLKLQLEQTTAGPAANPPNAVSPDVLKTPGGGSAVPAAGGVARLTAMCLPTAQIVIDGRPSGRWTPISATNPLEVPAGRHMVLCEAASGARSTPQELLMEAGNVVQYKAHVQ